MAAWTSVMLLIMAAASMRSVTVESFEVRLGFELSAGGPDDPVWLASLEVELYELVGGFGVFDGLDAVGGPPVVDAGLGEGAPADEFEGGGEYLDGVVGVLVRVVDECGEAVVVEAGHRRESVASEPVRGR